MTPERIKELRSLYQDRSTNARDVIHECLDEIERMKQGTETAMTNPARQAAERILDHVSTRWPIVRVNDVANIIQAAIDEATADITRERDERERAAKEMFVAMNTPENWLRSYPWLRDDGANP